MSKDSALPVLIVANSVSARFGGESILPLQYFRFLRERGVDVRLLTHDRTRDELKTLLGPDFARVTLLADDFVNKVLNSWSRWLPARVADFTVSTLSQWYDELRQRPVMRRLVREHGVRVVHVPVPVSPRLPSFVTGFGAPVIFGPMNGAMDYPPGFRPRRRSGETAVLSVLRRLSSGMNWLIPGKRKAALLVVANARTRNALPATLRRVETLTMPENGVDLTLFTPTRGRPESSGPVRLAFVGRLIDWKRVDLLIDACISIAGTTPLALHIVGDGPCLEPLKLQAGPLGDRVTFHGAVDQTEVARILAGCDVLVLPSMLECGGAVVLEAMAMGKPVIATRWGGPADYLDASCGVLIDPRTPEAFVRDLAEAIQQLAGAPALRTRLGAAGRARVERDFDWRAKAGYMLSIYSAVANCEQAHGAAELGRTTPA